MSGANPPPKWQEDAGCIGIDPEAFFPEAYDRGQDAEAAKAICRGCEVKFECLRDALDSGDDFAILGATTPRERRLMRRERRTA